MKAATTCRCSSIEQLPVDWPTALRLAGRPDQARLFLAGVAAHVQEVGWRATVQLDDVHGGHRQARPVHHAPNLTLQPDVVQVVLCCIYLPVLLTQCQRYRMPYVTVNSDGDWEVCMPWIFLRWISHVEDLFLPKSCIVVETKLSICCNQLPVRRFCQGINLYA